jgi:4-aminobutyrate aminotransferase
MAWWLLGLPKDGAKNLVLSVHTSGAESVEGALKLARHATGRPNIIVLPPHPFSSTANGMSTHSCVLSRAVMLNQSFQGSFHGRTIGAMSVTNSKNVYRAGYAPLMAGVHVAPYAYCYR